MKFPGRYGKMGTVEKPAWLAQLVEQRTENPRVSGSIPEPGIYGRRGAAYAVPLFECRKCSDGDFPCRESLQAVLRIGKKNYG